jgi:hypothetical protein
MALIKTHPDYMFFPTERKSIDGYPVQLYTDLLDYITERYGNEAWFALPCEVARFWRTLKFSSVENASASRETFCPSCRQAYAAGWLTNGCPNPDRPEREFSPATLLSTNTTKWPTS